MQYSQSVKTLTLAPASISSGGTASMILDTRGFAEARICVNAGTSNTATNNFSVLKIEQGDTTSAFSDLDGYVGDASGSWSIPNAVTSATACQPLVFNVDLLGKKRYLKVSASPTTTVLVGMQADMFRARISPDSKAESVAAIGADGVHVDGNTAALVVNPDGAQS